MRILITGIAGAVGSYMAEHIMASHPGHEITGIVRSEFGRQTFLARLNGRKIKNKPEIRIWDMSVNNLDHIEEVKPELIFHFASWADVRQSFDQPGKFLINNILSTVNLFESIRLCQIDPTIMLASTSEVYGKILDPSEVPIKETNPMRPVNPYAVSKAAQDLLGWTYFNSYGMRIIEGYGLTESSGGVCLTPTEGKRKIGSTGVAMEGVELKIFDENDKELGSGEIGEIVIRSDGVMKEYRGRPEETAEALRGGWLHTGDMGRLDEDEWLYIVDRKKEMVIRGGENIYPKELEDTLYAHPKISEVAVIGVPDEKYGEEVMACIVPKSDSGLTAEEVIAFCKDNMASYKIPRHVRFIDYIPKNIIGKVTKKELKQQMLEEMETK